MKLTSRASILSLIALTLALQSTSLPARAATLVSAYLRQLASPGMPAPTLPKTPPTPHSVVIASPGMPAPTLPKTPPTSPGFAG